MRGTIRPLLAVLFGAAVAASGLRVPAALGAPQRQRPRPSAPRARPTPQPKSTAQPKATTPAQTTAAPQATPAPQPTPAPTPAPTDAAAELRLGKQALRAARAAEALVHLEWALKLYEAGGNSSGQAAAHDLLGELYERQGQYETAVGHFQKALDIFGAKSADVERARATASAASTAASRVAPGAPDPSKAVVNPDAFNHDLTLSKIGNMHLRAGRPEEARAYFARMQAKKPDTSALRKSMSATEVGGSILGSILGGDKPTVSVPVGGVASLLVVKNRYELYHQTILYATKEIGQGRIDYAAGQFGPAREHFEAAVEATKGDLPFLGNLGQTRRFRTAARTALGDLALRQGRLSDAVESYRKAGKGARDDKRLDLMWPAQLGEGRALWAQAEGEKNKKKADERRAQALEALRAAVRTVDEIRQGSVRADEARTTFLATTREVYDEASAAHARMALMSAAPGSPLSGQALAYADEGLRLAEQGRARSLLDLLGESGGQLTEGIPAELLREKRANLERQSEIAAQLSGVAPDGAVPDKSVDKLEEDLEELQKNFDSLENRIREQNPRYKALTAPQPLALSDVQRTVLDDSTALLEYSLGEKESFLWAVTRDAAAVYRLPARAAIEEQAAALRDQLVPARLRRALVSTAAGTDVQRMPAPTDSAALPPAAAFAGAAHALYASVLAPAAEFVGGRRLLVAAEGALAYVPFEALLTAAPQPGADYASLPFLINTHEVVYTPSASVIDALRKQGQAASAPGPGSLLVVADPVFDRADPRVRGRQFPAPTSAAEASRGLTLKKAIKDVSPADAASAEGASLVRLDATRAEATQAAAAARAAGLRADPWLDLDASEENVSSRDLTAYRIIHFATHGLLDAEHPQFTGLVLTLVGNRERDGYLRTDEVFNLRLGRPLVMLSACETGLGKERRGEGVIGLTRAFMYAGAPAVGVTLWSVADQSTAELMTDFYRRLLAKERTPASEALRAARLQMIAGKRRAAPFYWAPFVLVGDWRAS